MPKKITGIVTSDVQNKTIVITVSNRETHPIYGKQYTVTRKYTAHDEKNQAKKGDKVEVSECRPYSKNKTWLLERVIDTGHADIEIADDTDVAEVTSPKATKEEE